MYSFLEPVPDELYRQRDTGCRHLYPSDEAGVESARTYQAKDHAIVSSGIRRIVSNLSSLLFARQFELI